MAFKGIISIGSPVTVTFHADPGNQGSSAVLIGWIPNGTDMPPDTQFDMVAPGGARSFQSMASPALALRITVDVPGGDDSGLLEVFENDVLKDRDTVGDTFWTYAVVD